MKRTKRTRHEGIGLDGVFIRAIESILMCSSSRISSSKYLLYYTWVVVSLKIKTLLDLIPKYRTGSCIAIQCTVPADLLKQHSFTVVAESV